MMAGCQEKKNKDHLICSKIVLSLCRHVWNVFHWSKFLSSIYSKPFTSHTTCISWSRTWGEEGGEIVKDLRIPLPSCETDHGADVEREGPQLLPRAQTVHFQHILHVVEETHKQVAGVGAGGEHCRPNKSKGRHQIRSLKACTSNRHQQ